MMKRLTTLFLLPLIISAPLLAGEAAKQKGTFEPEMVTIPGGSFHMGDLSGTGYSNQGPAHQVTIEPFQMGKYEVTKAEFASFIKASGYQTDAEKNTDGDMGCLVDKGGNWEWQAGTSWQKHLFKQTDNDPVVCISWNDASAYIEWLKGQSGKNYRLPTEAEWEHAARAGSKTLYPWGDEASHEHANYGKDECCGGFIQGRDQWEHTSPVGSFPANAYGLHDMHGNVWEWAEDCWNRSYEGAPTDGAAWNSGSCSRHVIRGGSWDDKPKVLRSPYRNKDHTEDRGNYIGFRLALPLSK
jgi:formylglycine-generating enzyme required for sulfatase activity